MSILIENVSKKVGRLSQINLEIPTGNLVALLGPSGSGKSTLLRALAGFEKLDEGRIWFSGKNSTYLPIQQRQIGFVFQDYALFPKMTIFENICFGASDGHRMITAAAEGSRWLRSEPSAGSSSRGSLPEVSKAESLKGAGEAREAGKSHSASSKLKTSSRGEPDLLNELLYLTQLENFSNFYPHQLSGGQKQRVAFARALAIEPKILLLDEPFGALDIKVRKNLRIWLRRLHEKLPVTSIFVTHDIHEAMEIADHIVVFKDGHIEQFGTPREIYEHPATIFVKNFLGII